MNATFLQPIRDERLDRANVNLFLKREDQNHPTIQGNKLRKLKYNLTEAKNNNYSTLLTFGGAFSNHLYAVAAAGKLFNFKTIGVVRGEKVLPLNDTLAFAEECGMTLHFISRQQYREKTTEHFLSDLRAMFGSFYLIPEGGSNVLAVRGCKEIVQEINMPFDYLCTPVGTGGTMAGLIAGAENRGQVLGFAALKGASFLVNDVTALLTSAQCPVYDNWQIVTDYHFGGYAKQTPELLNFMRSFEKTQGVLLEPIYTAKMLYGIFDLVEQNFFKPNSNIIAIHTGGLQGRGHLPF
jgi:1-aminocyclopropane-1-carboxylate deaminase/D-cysteine desulfhydrase-like pyridoxal-dependent ACC family enzyme